MLVASTVTMAPPTPPIGWTLPRIAEICALVSALFTVKVPLMPLAAMLEAPSAIAPSCSIDMLVASTVAADAVVRNALICAVVKVESRLLLAALQANASLMSNAPSLSSSRSQALPRVSLSQLA